MAFHCFTSAGREKELSLQIRPSMSSLAEDDEVRNERLDQIAARVLDGFGAAEMGGIFLNEGRIEVVLADQEAELIPEPAGAAV